MSGYRPVHVDTVSAVGSPYWRLTLNRMLMQRWPYERISTAIREKAPRFGVGPSLVDQSCPDFRRYPASAPTGWSGERWDMWRRALDVEQRRARGQHVPNVYVDTSAAEAPAVDSGDRARTEEAASEPAPDVAAVRPPVDEWSEPEWRALIERYEVAAATRNGQRVLDEAGVNRNQINYWRRKLKKRAA